MRNPKVGKHSSLSNLQVIWKKHRSIQKKKRSQNWERFLPPKFLKSTRGAPAVRSKKLIHCQGLVNSWNKNLKSLGENVLHLGKTAGKGFQINPCRDGQGKGMKFQGREEISERARAYFWMLHEHNEKVKSHETKKDILKYHSVKRLSKPTWLKNGQQQKSISVPIENDYGTWMELEVNRGQTIRRRIKFL